MKTRNDEYPDYRTRRQWALRGCLPKPGERGTALWANRHHQAGFLYFSPEQVEQATPEALAEFFRPERERRNQRARALRRKKKEEKALRQQEREQAERDAAISKAVTPLLNQLAELHQIICHLTEQVSPSAPGTRCLVLDTETTGLDPCEHELLECSIIDTKEEVLFHSYVRPCAKAWPEAQAVNGITPDMVQDAPTISQCREEISRVLHQASTIIGYNTGFDLAFLAANGITVPRDVEIVDVMALFAPIYGEWSETFQDYKWQSLLNCAGHYGYDWSSHPGLAHDSLADCYATLFCYQAIEKETDSRDDGGMIHENHSDCKR